MRFPRYPAALLMALWLTGCAAQDTTQPSLYSRLGGMDTIEAVVENMLYRVADDPNVVVFFANTNIDHFADAFATQLCDISDGPCQYKGPPMDRAHQHMGINDAHFNRVVEYLTDALGEEGVPLAAQNELLGRLAPLHADVMRRQ
ncbi:group 1 truncated hemoglobin [Vreelandella arcis]|uniref:Group 1 truncated hemoglobin n=1 Tax=Vreelandella arcis TaxID=416873 RepID=A0A1G9Y950_9GAMM|nr:group 1 truncated hemoglobin [Halomonas arcis]SDN05540.1 hemoglobin [Halomonas arcis]